jgi:hypothetical protein
MRDLTDRYNDYAVYLPSLQQPYAEFAMRGRSDVRQGKIPRNFRPQDLDFLSSESRLWTCKYALYSAGQFEGPFIEKDDMIANRKREGAIIVGDSGGYQLGTGKIKSKREKESTYRYADSPDEFCSHWFTTGFRERVLNWLDAYTDYAMTLDLPLWASKQFKADSTSPLRNLSVDQLIALSVDNLRYFEANRARSFGGEGTKFLNVIQDAEHGAGQLWYDAVKDFEFEGWAFGGTSSRLKNLLVRLRSMLDEGRLHRTELIHLLAKSPPINSVIYTAIQQALSKAANRPIRLTYDSSSPHRASGMVRAIYLKPELTSSLRSWRMSSVKIPQNLRVARGHVTVDLPEFSPLSRIFNVNHLVVHTQKNRLGRVDSLSEQLMTNHNIYTFHDTALDASDLVFGRKPDFSRVPTVLQHFVEFVNAFFESDRSGQLLIDSESVLQTLDPDPKPK